MKDIIFARNDVHGKIDFYMDVNGAVFYLFRQDYRFTVYNFYKDGVHLERALRGESAHSNHLILDTMVRLIKTIRYIEKNEGLVLLERTKRRCVTGRKCAA